MDDRLSAFETRSIENPVSATHGARLQRHIIEAVTPAVDCGRYAVKRIVGEECVVEADIFRDGHETVRAALKWRRKQDTEFYEEPMRLVDNDRWRGVFHLAENTRYIFTIEAWTDRYASWFADFSKKALAGRDVASDLKEGIALLDAVRERTTGKARVSLSAALDHARLCLDDDPADAVDSLFTAEIEEITARYGDRGECNRYPQLLEVIADRPLAQCGAWYEMFPRSYGKTGKNGTLREAEAHLSYVRDLGFDIVYLPPIHPIGLTNRKAPNNRLGGNASSPGSPWAIGSSAGGHMAVEPALGSLDDFDHFLVTAQRLDLEIAIDFAIQASPDHPWVREHPEWFRHRPDGTIKYAENPPKEYQDVYPINFDGAAQSELVGALHSVLEFWIKRGVKIFRVDNPHTKPVRFWEWLISDIQSKHPEVIFLAEAFTRPKMMRVLAKAGFSQSYTYFTWRNTKAELTEYLTELADPDSADYFRPNFFTNTPDILSGILQNGGPPAFKIRVALAATLSPSYGIYSGYELCENQAVAGTEEYMDSEKYQIKNRDWHTAGNIREYIALLNQIRKNNPALHELENVQFLPSDSNQIIFYAKATADKRNMLLVAVNLDPVQWHECTVTVPPELLGVPPGSSYSVTDLITGAAYTWGEHNYVRLDPHVEPAHILRVAR